MKSKSSNSNGQRAKGVHCSALREGFRCCAHAISLAVGTPWAFMIAFATILGWGITGPLFKFSDTWQLVINTATTIITFLMVFIIQNTQNRDTKAIHLKLDELLRGVKGARTSLVNLEALSDEELDRLQEQFETLQRSRANDVSEEERENEDETDENRTRASALP